MPRPKRVDIKKAVKLHNQGVSQSEIARTMHVTPSAVNQALKEFNAALASREELEAYRNNELDLYDSFIVKYGRHALTDQVVKKTSGAAAGLLVFQAHTNRRLITGQTTQNVGVVGFLNAMHESLEDPKKVPESFSDSEK